MTSGEVYALIGAPFYPNWPTNGEEPTITHWERYTNRPLPENVEYHDNLALGYADGRLVRVYAGRVVGRVVDPAGGNPRLAYTLTVTDNGHERREFGPAFEEVFQCEPGFERPTDD